MQQNAKALCDDLGITLIAYSPLALGLLSGELACHGATMLACALCGETVLSFVGNLSHEAESCVWERSSRKRLFFKRGLLY